MTTTYSYLVSLASALVVLVNIEGRCVRVAEVTEINIEGYRTRAVHTNACRETSSAAIMPRISVGFISNKTYIKRYEDSCCCSVTSSRQMVCVSTVYGLPVTGSECVQVSVCTRRCCSFTGGFHVSV